MQAKMAFDGNAYTMPMSFFEMAPATCPMRSWSG